MEGLRGADTGRRDSMTDGRCGLLMGAWNAGRAQSVSLWPRKWCQEPLGVSPIHALSSQLGGAAGFYRSIPRMWLQDPRGELTFLGRTSASPSTPSSLTAHRSQHGD